MNTHKVIWQEGMLLRPQHFQHNDRYYDHQMKTRTQLLGGYTWGFLNLEIDLQFLNMGKLVISAASGILPDGSLFELGGNTEPLALDVPPNTGNTPITWRCRWSPATTSRRAARSSPTCWRVTPRTTPKWPTPTPATIPPARSAAVARTSNCCSASSRAIRPT
jgi:hypothetical protein